MGRRSKSETYLARFPRLREIRTELGLEVIDIAVRLPGNRPSLASIYRLEQGQALRVSNTRRIFDLLNEASGGKLNYKKEIELVKSDEA